MGAEKPLKELLGLGLVALLFVAAALFADHFHTEAAAYLEHGRFSMVAYVFAGALATVLAPISTVPLIPLAAKLWGPFAAALLNIIAWTIGALFAFLIARKLGKPFVMRFARLDALSRYERALGDKNLFWNVVALRMAIPVDVLSYALGFFTSMKTTAYLAATVLGITPFAFVLSYAAGASLVFQLAAGLLVLGAVYLGYRKVKTLKVQNAS